MPEPVAGYQKRPGGSSLVCRGFKSFCTVALIRCSGCTLDKDEQGACAREGEHLAFPLTVLKKSVCVCVCVCAGSCYS